MIVFLLIFCLAAAAAESGRPKPPPEVAALVDLARAVAPEFSADILLQVAESQQSADRQWKRELLEEAFQTAARAQWPFKRKGGVHTDTRPSRQAWDNGLDALALRTRAVRAMLSLDPRGALLMFQDIRLGELPSPTCQDVLTPDVSAYYQTAAKVFERGFTRTQRKEEEDIRFLEQLVRGIGSPAQVHPAGRLVLEAPITRAQRQTLLNVFAASLDRVSGSARVFAANESGLIDLEYAAMRAGLDLTALVPALRSYLVRHVGGPRCSDSLRGGKAPEAVEDFNAWVARLNAGGADFKPISPEEARPLRDGGTYTLVEMWKSPRSLQVLAGLRWLNHGNRDLPGDQRFWTLEERSTNEWNARYLDFLKLIEGWKEEEEASPEDYFMMKADAYSLLANLAPPGPRRDAALGNFLAFLEQQYALIENHNLWFMESDRLLRKARDAKDPRDSAYFLNAMLRSANPVVALYAKLQQVLLAQRQPQR